MKPDRLVLWAAAVVAACLGAPAPAAAQAGAPPQVFTLDQAIRYAADQ